MRFKSMIPFIFQCRLDAGTQRNNLCKRYENKNKYRRKVTSAGTVSLSQCTLLGAYSIWLEKQSAVPVVWVVK